MTDFEITSKLSLRKANDESIEGLEDEDVTRLTARINQNDSTLTSVKAVLTNNEVVLLANAARSNTHLKSLDLSKSLIGDTGGKALAEMLCKNASITELYLNIAFFPNDDDQLYWTGNKCISMLFAALKSGNKTLKVLSLQGAEDSEMDPGMCRGIDFDRAKIIGNALRFNTTLEELNLSNTHFRAGALSMIAEGIKCNKALKELNLSWTSCNDEEGEQIIKAIAKHPTLRFLSLESTGIGDDTAIASASALKVNTTLTTLDLENCKIEVKGVRALIRAIAQTRSLHFLLLKDNPGKYNYIFSTDSIVNPLVTALRVNSGPLPTVTAHNLIPSLLLDVFSPRVDIAPSPADLNLRIKMESDWDWKKSSTDFSASEFCGIPMQQMLETIKKSPEAAPIEKILLTDVVLENGNLPPDLVRSKRTQTVKKMCIFNCGLIGGKAGAPENKIAKAAVAKASH